MVLAEEVVVRLFMLLGLEEMAQMALATEREEAGEAQL
jgi:hypothetical protein